MIKRMMAGAPRMFGALAALALTACATHPEAPAEARPAMWKLADDDTTIYLFGTFHLLPPGHQWRSAKIDAAIAESAELVTEVGDVGDMAAISQAMASLAVSPGLPPLIERVPEDKRDELRQMIAESGVPAAILDRMETWAAALSMLGVTFTRLGLDPEAGVEAALTGTYKRAGKPISGLETVAQQFGLFDSLPEKDQRAFLVAMLDDPAELKREFARMLAAWSSGDVEGVAATFNEEANMSAELRERLLERRNAAWADWLAARLDRPGTVFVAVGAGHLAGPVSVQAKLDRKGLKTRRVQ